MPTDARDSSGEKKPTLAADNVDGDNSTSIRLFQQNESLAGFITRNSNLSDSDFLRTNHYPALLTAMPDEINFTVWAVVLPIRKKVPHGKTEELLSQQIKNLYLEIAAKSGRFYVGRAPECDIVLAPRSVSRRHAYFECDGAIWRLVDLGSTNGTKVDDEQLMPKSSIVLGDTPTKIDFGNDTRLWFVKPTTLLNYIKRLQAQVPITSQHKLPPPESFHSAHSETPQDPIPMKPKPEPAPTITSIRRPSLSLENTQIKVERSEAETNPLIRETMTWHDYDDDSPKNSPKSVVTESLPTSDPEPRLMTAIKTIIAMDSLILSVTAQLRSDSRIVTLFTAEEQAKTDAVAEQLMRLGPLLKRVWLTLSVGNGTPVEVYSNESVRMKRAGDGRP